MIDIVRTTYLLHAAKRTTVPHSVFLRFPGDDVNRIIALPAYVDNRAPVAGLKWIASFPGNVSNGLNRASGVIILNSVESGYSDALVEASTISAQRTAASAALAAATLAGQVRDTRVSLIGCGVINFEVIAFLRQLLGELGSVTVFDIDRHRSVHFVRRCRSRLGDVELRIVDHAEEALEASSLVSVATTATAPYLDASRCLPGTLLLHLSLRDITAESVAASVNIVDDLDHVCRERTSIALAADLTGNRGFIAGELPQLLAGGERGRSADRVTVFSPFGLGALDVALADFVRNVAREQGIGTTVDEFFPGGV